MYVLALLWVLLGAVLPASEEVRVARGADPPLTATLTCPTQTETTTAVCTVTDAAGGDSGLYTFASHNCDGAGTEAAQNTSTGYFECTTTTSSGSPFTPSVTIDDVTGNGPTTITGALTINAATAFGACTDGTNCLCDQTGYIVGSAAVSGGGTVRYCQDFDDLSWNDDTGDAAYNAGFTEGGSFNCPDDKGVAGGVDEGTDPNDCFDIVTEPDCGVSGTSDCAFGNAAFGHHMVKGYTHGHAAKPNWAGLTEYGFTMAVKYADNFEFNGTAGCKASVEMLHNSDGNTNGYPFGQCQGMGVGTFSPEAYPLGYASEPTVSGSQNTGLGTRTNFTGACSSGEISGINITKGLIACDGNQTHWTAFETDFEDGDGSFPNDRWGCMRCHMTGIGSSDMGLTCWWQDETDTAEAKIIEWTGYDSTTAELGLPITGISFNPYFNGVQTASCNDGLTEANSGGYGSTGCNPPNFTYSPTADDSYIYNDNLVITDGLPVTCAEIGL